MSEQITAADIRRMTKYFRNVPRPNDGKFLALVPGKDDSPVMVDLYQPMPDTVDPVWLADWNKMLGEA